MAESSIESLSKAVIDLTEDAGAEIHVLLVDDEAGFLKNSKQILQMQGNFKIGTASSVDEAKKKMKRRTYDVIISDYVMPGKDGLQFLGELRGDGDDIPFIMFTGKGREEVAVRALNLGADQYLNKGGSPETVYRELAHAMDKIVQGRRAERALVRSEEKYRSIVQMAPDGIVTVDMKGVIMSVNPAFSELTGFSEEEIAGKHFTELQTIRAKDIPEYLKIFSSILKGKTPSRFEFRYLRKDGSERWGEGNVALQKAEGKNIGVQMILRDITEQKYARVERDRMEAQRKHTKILLKRSDERHKALLEETPIGICNVDIKGRVTYANKKLEEITGFSKEELQGKSIFNLARGLVSREYWKIVTGRMKRKLMGKSTTPLRLPLVGKNQDRIWVEAESKVIRKLGVPTGFQATLRDITDLVETEKSLKESMKKLETLNEKLSVVGKLTRHDVRNKLSIVTNNIYLAKKKVSGDREGLTYLEGVESACGEMERILDFARTYEKLGAEELTYLNVEQALEGAVKFFSGLHEVEVVSDCHGLAVLADSMLMQLFYNLIDNSLKHGENVSQIRVCYESRKDKVRLVYSDDGVGIPGADKEMVFKEGYGKGSGHGLYLIRKICEVYGWTVQETGRQGKGAQFTITMPKMNKDGKMVYQLH